MIKNLTSQIIKNNLDKVDSINIIKSDINLNELNFAEVCSVSLQTRKNSAPKINEPHADRPNLLQGKEIVHQSPSRYQPFIDKI